MVDLGIARDFFTKVFLTEYISFYFFLTQFFVFFFPSLYFKRQHMQNSRRLCLKARPRNRRSADRATVHRRRSSWRETADSTVQRSEVKSHGEGGPKIISARLSPLGAKRARTPPALFNSIITFYRRGFRIARPRGSNAVRSFDSPAAGDHHPPSAPRLFPEGNPESTTGEAGGLSGGKIPRGPTYRPEESDGHKVVGLANGSVSPPTLVPRPIPLVPIGDATRGGSD